MTAILPAKSVADRLTTLFWRKPKLLLILLITPPLLWLGVVYLGSLAALLMQSFYSIDEFSGMVIPEFTLKTYAELLRPQNYDVIFRTLLMSAAVTLGCAILALAQRHGCFILPPGNGWFAANVIPDAGHEDDVPRQARCSNPILYKSPVCQAPPTTLQAGTAPG